MVSLQPFEQVIRDFGPTVLRICRATVLASDVEDAWQDTFIAALRAYPTLDPEVNVEAWLVTIAKHKAIDRIRARRETTVDLADHTNAHHDDLGAVEGIWTIVGELPPRQKESLALRYLMGLSYREIAEILGGTEQTCRRATADGLSTLRKRYEVNVDAF